MEQLLIFPYNGNGLEALACAQGQYDVIGFVDDTPAKQASSAHGLPVLSRAAFQRYSDAKVLAVPGSPTSYLQRQQIIASLQLPVTRFATVLHPRASIATFAQIGYNVLIMAGVAITSNAVIGNHVCVLPNTVVHHDVQLGDYTLIGANIVIAGHTRIGVNCYVGSGSNIINQIAIGDHTLVGMGSNVLCSLPADSKAVGNPARIIGVTV